MVRGRTEDSSEGEGSPEFKNAGFGQGSRGQRWHDDYRDEGRHGGGQSRRSHGERRGEDGGGGSRWYCSGPPERPWLKRSEGSSRRESRERQETRYVQGSWAQRLQGGNQERGRHDGYHGGQDCYQGGRQPQRRRRWEDRDGYRGSHPDGGSQQYHGESPEQPQQKQRRGTDPPQCHGESGSSYAGKPSRSLVPDLYQATPAPLQPVITLQPMFQADEPSHQFSVQQDTSKPYQQLSVQQDEPEPSHQFCVKQDKPVRHELASNKSIKLPLRPGIGSRGTRCIVKANHFFAELPDMDLHHYDVTITPEVTSYGVNRAVMEKLVKLYRNSDLGNRLPAYDGKKSLYTAGPFPFISKEFKITLVDKDDGSSRTSKKRDFVVVIKLASHASMHHLEMFLAGRVVNAPQEAFQVLDIVLQQLPMQRYFYVGRSYFSPNLGRTQSLSGGVESWRGFYQSMRPTQMGLSLNINMSSTVFIEAVPVIDFVKQLLNRDDSTRPLSDADLVKIKKALKGIKVEITHRGNMRRRFVISGLTTQPTRELKFPDGDRGTMTYVVDYFRDAYGVTIQHVQWPCLQLGKSQRRNYMPMEVCKIVEGQRYSRRLNERQITAFLKVTCQRPPDREQSILKTVSQNAYDQDPYAKEFGLKISTELASIEARILPPPRLKYHETGREQDCLPQVGQWNMMNKKLVNAGTVANWICINFARNVQDKVARTFCSEIAQMCNTFGMKFNPLPVLPVLSGRPDQVERVLKAHFHDAMIKLKLQPDKKELDLLIAILPDNNGSLYGDLKKICETDLGIISQCCLAKNVFRVNRQYLSNVALKINVKVGGRNTVLADALSRRIPNVSDIPTIIFGADVTHPQAGDGSGPSIAAVVASQDWPEITKYAGLVSAQAPCQELIEDLYKEPQDPKRSEPSGGMIRELLISFRRATGHKPKRIIFYRDGVSEGQFYQVLLHELDAIRKACASLEPNYQPPVTFVVVQKRHHTRLFANNHRDRNSVDRSGNIIPGTVIDTKICHPTEFDFYLCSHAGIQGTSRPSHYHVLWDENNFSADDLQSLTNNLCYTYARCTRSISVVPPAYYAHLAAFRARYYMEPSASDSASMISGRGTAPTEAVRPLPALKESIKRVMFYC